MKSNQSCDILIFGDSHAKCFGRDKTFEFGGLKFKNIYMSSASARGLLNNKSTLGSSRVIFSELDKSKKISACVFKFGQVDIEFNYYFKVFKEKQELSKKDFFESVVSDYMQFLLLIKQNFPDLRIVVCGVNAPNEYDWVAYNKLYGTSCPDIPYDVRFEDHMSFNDRLKDKCLLYDILYFDLNKEVTDGIGIKKQFIGSDNHFSGAEASRRYNDNTYSVFLKKLIKCINTSADAETTK